MKTILVDDMLLDLQLFELKCADMPDFEIVGKFTDPNAAIEYAAGHVVDFALLDIDMPGMDGIHLAQALRRLRSDIIIVFATAHPKFAVEALKMKADYIIFKPFDREDIADVMERAKLLRRRQCKRIHFHTFGAFDMLVDGEPVHFRSGKAKELIFSGKMIKADEAERIGLVNAVFAPEELMNGALEMARSFTKNAPIAVRACKKAINDGMQVDIDRAVAIEEGLFGSCFETADQKEGMGAFLEKRKHEPYQNK